MELTLRGIAWERQVEIDVVYKGHIIKGQRIDLLVAKEVVVDVKSLSKLPEVATAQVLSYLHATSTSIISHHACLPGFFRLS